MDVEPVMTSYRRAESSTNSEKKTEKLNFIKTNKDIFTGLDMLSRASIPPDDDKDDVDMSDVIHAISLEEYLPIPEEDIKKLKNASALDPTLQELSSWVHRGWKNINKKVLSSELKVYYGLKDDITEKEGKMIYLILALAIVWTFFKLYTHVFNYWENRGFPYIEGKFPLGSDPCLSRPKKFLGLEVQEHYRKLMGHPLGGIYVGRRPDLIVRDPKIIKNIMVKDFAHFRNRSVETSSKNNPLTQHLFALEGPKWRALRVKLTPTFTSGKLKLMYSLFVECAQRLEHKLQADAMKNEGVVDIKDTIARFTTDVIGSCAFGLEIDSLNNPEEPFRKIGVRLFKRNLKGRLIELLYSLFPGLRKYINLSRTSKELEKMFMSGIGQTIEYRQKNNVRRNDFLDLLIELKNQGHLLVDRQKDSKVDEGDYPQDGDEQEKIEMDLGMITAQCFVFFIAGFETSSSVQSYALYELAYHPVVQDRVRREIEEVTNKFGGVNYQALNEMPYLDQVINETIRKYPTLHTLTRVCTKPYAVPGTKYVIEEGIRVLIPVYALHHDAQYFPDPERFDPDRFSDANKSSITPFTFLPFGEGPRNCIGMRFGLLQTKIGLVTLLKNQRVSPTSQTKSPLVFNNSLSVISQNQGSIVLKVESV